MKNNKEILKLPKRKWNLFIVCLLLSFISWFFIQLSEVYTGVITFGIRYKNIPKNLILREAKHQKIQATVKASGYYLFISKLRQKRIDVDLAQISNRKKGIYVLRESQFSPKITSQIDSDVEILGVDVHELIFEMEDIIEKKVVVIPQIDLIPASNHMMVGAMRWFPDSVVVYGASKDLANIEHLKTRISQQENLKTKFQEDVYLNLEDYAELQLNFSHEKIKIEAEFQEFTEKEFDLEIKVHHLPESVSIKTFPSKVHLVCQIPVNKVQSIQASDFEVSANFDQIQNNILKVSVSRKPFYVKNVEVDPQQVTFLLKKM
ncbi:MAG: hypothetical protein OIF50_02775 [Flavobacteriaceae bacterium]|nr:hypothetical protein [Flavobacteriaceae bacterium]